MNHWFAALQYIYVLVLLVIILILQLLLFHSTYLQRQSEQVDEAVSVVVVVELSCSEACQ